MRVCKICFNNIENSTFHSILCKDVSICHKCFLQLKPNIEKFKFCNVDCIHIYFYEEKIQELLYQFKGCKDYELKSIFLEYYKSYLNHRFSSYIMIPAPSSKDSDLERGFNHVEEMYSCLKMKALKCIHKTKKVKQADLNKEERKEISKCLVIDDVDLRGKNILIVDDVFTTGSTVKAMIELVKSRGAKKIKVLVMSKTLDLDKR